MAIALNSQANASFKASISLLDDMVAQRGAYDLNSTGKCDTGSVTYETNARFGVL